MDIPHRAQHTENEPFETFFEGWLTRQAQFLQELLDIQTQLMTDRDNDNELKVQVELLIGRVMAHYIEYYDAKSLVVQHNVFIVFTPPWLTPYERVFLWIAGFRPSLMVRILTNSGVEFTAEQVCRMEMLTAEISSEEGQLSEQLLRAERELTSPSILALARMAGREVDGMVNDIEREIERLMMIMKDLVARADYFRRKTVFKIMNMLDASQTVRFLTAVAHLQLNLRSWGTQIQRDALIRG